MKALKNKIISELKKHELRASISETDISKKEIDEVYWLSKTLCYLDKAEVIINTPVK